LWLLLKPVLKVVKKNKIGVGMAFLGDPVPSVSSYQLKYNVSKYLQVLGSYGKAGSLVTSYGAAAKVFLIPAWSLSPYVGAGYGYAKVSGNFTLGSNTIDVPEDSLTSIVASAGIDHQAFIGFNVGAGVNYVIKPSQISDAFSIIPYFHFAWFF
jgi:opacity protein-like surface antigen